MLSIRAETQRNLWNTVMAMIDDAVNACLEECKDAKAPGVFVEGYFRELAGQPGWTDAELAVARRRVLDSLHQSIVARHPAVFSKVYTPEHRPTCV